ncbi:MAG: excinuclease ABC subunit UvrC [Treponema sp.]|jgi:excinuclease ABC subunit C|nr:excinuclease ABC subunit UvrC [Treponema sp.]
MNESFSDNYAPLREIVRNTPQEPGVYIMKDEENRIVYIGKARILKNRLNSYFAGGKDIKTATLLRHVRSIETIIVANEYEALLLENTLIKQHTPKYNINLKDGKTYPVIRISAEEFPRIFRTRHIIEDGSRYFGPFPNIQAVDTMLDLVDKIFPLRKCKSAWRTSPKAGTDETDGTANNSGAGGGSSRRKKTKRRTSPCMYYRIGRCEAPCCGRISAAEYAETVKRVEKLLEGETGALVVDLTARMHDAARELKFERAAQIRNAIKAIEELAPDITVVDFDPEGRDYIAWASESVLTTFTVFSMRGGKMTGREIFRARSAADEQDSLETFIASYYNPAHPPPPKIYLASVPGEDPLSGTRRWFREQFGYEPALLPPGERRHQAALALARQNAEEDIRRRIKERGAGPALDELKQALSLKNRPERIEGFDIAQLDGKHPVASLVSFKDGIPDRKNYRYFKLRTVIGVVDDFASMREAVHRRYSRLIREGKDLPDLVLIDGGIGQVNAAKGVMDELGADCDVAGLAKRDEELWLPHTGEPVRLSKRSEALKVLQFVRDETHRFATTLNQKLRSADLLFPALESVEGIGAKRAAAIMEAFATLEAIAAAAPEIIAEKCRLGAGAARAVRAAAKLALEDRAAAEKRLASGLAAPAPRGMRRGKAAAEAGLALDSRSVETGAALAQMAADSEREYPQ